MAGCNSVSLSDTASLHCASVFCRVQGYTASPSSLLPPALRALCVLLPPLGKMADIDRAYLGSKLQSKQPSSRFPHMTSGNTGLCWLNNFLCGEQWYPTRCSATLGTTIHHNTLGVAILFLLTFRNKANGITGACGVTRNSTGKKGR